MYLDESEHALATGADEAAGATTAVVNSKALFTELLQTKQG